VIFDQVVLASSWNTCQINPQPIESMKKPALLADVLAIA
jgi:hypothetical protein